VDGEVVWIIAFGVSETVRGVTRGLDSETGSVTFLVKTGFGVNGVRTSPLFVDALPGARFFLAGDELAFSTLLRGSCFT